MPITPKAKKPFRMTLGEAGLIGLAVVVIGVIVGGPVVVKSLIPPPPQTDDDGCLTPGPDPAHLAVLIDASDPIPIPARMAARDLIAKAIDEAPQFGRISVYRLTANPASPLQRLASGCRIPPVREIDSWVDEKDPYWTGRGKAEKAALQASNALVDEGRLDDSPILQALTALTRKGFPPGKPRRTLLIVSDMLQRTDGLDLYRRDLALGDVVAKNRWNELPDLDGAQVKVVHIRGRSEDPDGGRAAAAERFWREVFRASGAQGVTIKPIDPTRPDR